MLKPNISKLNLKIFAFKVNVSTFNINVSILSQDLHLCVCDLTQSNFFG